MQLGHFTRYQLLAITPLLVLLVTMHIVLGVYSFIIPVILLIYILYEKYGDEVIAIPALFSLIGFSSDIGEELRTILNGLAFLVFVVIYLKNSLYKGILHFNFPSVLSIFFVIVMASMAVSTIFSGYYSVGLPHMVRQIIFFVLLYFLYNIYDNYSAIQRLLDYIALTSIFVAGSIIFSFFESINSIEKLLTEVLVKESGMFSNVAAPAGLIAIGIIILNYRMIFGEGILIKSKLFCKWLLALLILGIILTNSRAAILGAGAGVIIFQLLVNRRQFLRFSIWAGFIGLILFFVFIEFFDILNLYFRTERVLENTRYPIWELTWNMIESHYLTGMGPGVPKFAWTQYSTVMFDSWSGEQISWVFEHGGLGHSHNFLLFRWSELGIPGLLTTLWMFLYFPFIINKKRKSANNEKKNKQAVLLTMVFAICIGVFMRSFFEATGILSYGWVSRDLPFWVILMIAFASTSSEEDHQIAGKTLPK